MYETLNEADFAQHFMPRLAVPDHETWLGEDFALSAAMRERLPHRRNVRYGPGPLQVIDLFPAKAPNSPVFVFIHGGYWRALSKDHFGFIAEPLLDAGAAVAMVDYDLCPAVSLATVVEQVAQAVAWVRGQARGINGDPDHLVIAGNSAGAHLAAMMLSRDWNEADGASFIRGAVLVTGIYDLAPIPHIQVREDVALNSDDIERLSPMRLEPLVKAPVLVAVGGDEPDLWIGQSAHYHRRLIDARMEAEFMLLPGHHHFSISRCLAEPDGRLFGAMRRLLAS
ncbi:alpha/beta hydrolase [Dongia sedimenti]|uniref:Alpha/beta hydrolase n=1 Tax=Dongia sedimenti TaxID=3064282 RepID=A0ABU0YT66_9PROT|nr:alpha/beta hydrolase [Rhodospirillaceae bacterium R-7]